MRYTITQRLLFGLLAALALVGAAGCTDEYMSGGKGDMVPLRLTASFLSATDTVQTRATTTPFEVKVALSTSSGFANGAKTYVATDNGSGQISFTPKTDQDKLMVSRLQGSTPLTIWGEHPNGMPLFCSYSPGATLTNGAISIGLDDARSQVAVRVKSQGKYMAAKTFDVSTNILFLPEKDTNGKYEWDTSGKKPYLAFSQGVYATDVKNTEAEEISAVETAEWMTVRPAIVMKAADLFTLTIGDKYYKVTMPGTSFTFEANTRYLITVDFDKGVVIDKITIEAMTQKDDIEIREKPGIYNLQDLKDFRDAWNEFDDNAGFLGGADKIGSGRYNKWLKNGVINLYADIDMTGETTWLPIGAARSISVKSVTFEGNGHTIKNFTSTEHASNQVSGLFGYLSAATIQNLTVDNFQVTVTEGSVGGIVSFIEEDGVVISNCHVKNSSFKNPNKSNASDIGGIACFAGGNTVIKACSVSNTNMTGADMAGIADLSNATVIGCMVSKCTFTDIVGSGSTIGGIARSNSTVKGCAVYDLNIKGADVSSSTPTYFAITNSTNPAPSDCYYQNVKKGANLETTITNETGYCATVAELNNKISTMNKVLYNYSTSFGYHYEEVSGYPALVEGNPAPPSVPGIHNLQDLKDFRDAWNANGEAGIAQGKYSNWVDNGAVTLYADIDMNNEEWTPISGTDINIGLTLNFNGNNHTISNLQPKLTTIEVISNLKMDFCSFIAVSTGKISSLTINNLKANGTASNALIGGGIAGMASTIENCKVTGKIDVTLDADGFFGGIASAADEIRNCHVLGSNSSQITLKGQGSSIGGIITDSSSGGSVTILGCQLNGVVLTAVSSVAGISTKGGADNKIVGCLVANAQLIATETTSSSSSLIVPGDSPMIGLVTYNINLKGADLNTFKSNSTSCFFLNLKAGDVVVDDANITGYCSSASVLNSNISTLNVALKTYSTSFGYKYAEVDGYPALVEGNP